MLKSKLREKILKIRKNINTKNIKIDFEKILNLIKKKGITKKNIGGYYPVNFEVDTKDLMTKLQQKGFKISLPVIKNNFNMDFYKWNLNDPLYLNKYGIPEPERKKKVKPNIFLIPLVAFDKELNRLGYGGGYYDRLFEKKENINMIKIGLALSCQKVIKVPTDKFDKKLDYIITERNSYK